MTSILLGCAVCVGRPGNPARLNLRLVSTPSIPTVFDNLPAMFRRQPKALRPGQVQRDPGSKILFNAPAA